MAGTKGSSTKAPPGSGLEGGWQLAGIDAEGRRLRLVLGETALKRAYLGLTIGRHPKLADILVNDPGVSRRHLRIGRDGGGLIAEDLNSLNGTRIEGEPVRPFEPVRLQEGQSLEFGGITVTLSRLEG